jgi:hypothetical protein
MDDHGFDDLLRALSQPRRSFLAGVVAIAAGWRGGRDASAKKKRKRKHRKKRRRTATPNEFGCLEVGDPCKSSDQCCSGICDGKKDNKSCRAHGGGT